MPDAIPFGTSVHRARDEGSPPDLSRRSSTHHRSLDGILDENASPTNPHLSSSLPPLSNDNASSSASTDTALDESYLLDSCSTLLDETKDTDKSRTSNENSAKDANRPSMPFDARLVDVRVPEAPLSDVFGDCIAPVVPFPLPTSLHSRRPRITPRPTFRGLLWVTTRTPSESLANSVLDEEFLPTARHLPSPSQKLASRRPRGCR
ncbi:hypothetical protein BV22DRAFT_625928 [Leucogyrophana mollusca]|uniref:Uncharacterized protein n=1 Tax=Leucogyrophana mollusca TaxID=85980 RepID=A0ACB8BB31_9AGAM|nr:hypothetical protein BV22DRAFT_625928 [Leucogyrophana mollusca]